MPAIWGSDADLFARGIAERVDDRKLGREPLEKPGTVIKRSRGTTAEQLAALPPDRPSESKANADAVRASSQAAIQAKGQTASLSGQARCCRGSDRQGGSSIR